MYVLYLYIESDIDNSEGYLSPGGHSSCGRALIQSRMSAGISQFSKNIPKPFHHVHVHVQYSIHWTHTTHEGMLNVHTVYTYMYMYMCTQVYGV